MSDGRSFSKDNIELTLDERLAELERKIPIYMDRIKSYDILFDKFQRTHETVLALQSHLKYTSDRIEDLKKEQQQQLDKISSRQDTIVDTFNRLSAYAESQKINNEMSLKNIVEKQNSHTDVLSSLKKKMEEDASKYSLKNDLESLKTLQSKINNISKDQVDSVTEKVVQSMNAITEHAKSIKDTLDMSSAHQTLLSEIAKNIQSLSIGRNMDTKQINETFSYMRKEFAESIEDLRKQIPAKSPEIDSKYNEILKSCELTKLDGTNAVLRATNNEKHVQLLQKQIENIYLLLKKHELSQ
jgi:chromosome segregation ATPase